MCYVLRYDHVNFKKSTSFIFMYFVDGPNRNEWQGYLLGGKGGQCVRLISLPPSCADCLEILEASNSWSS